MTETDLLRAIEDKAHAAFHASASAAVDGDPSAIARARAASLLARLAGFLRHLPTRHAAELRIVVQRGTALAALLGPKDAGALLHDLYPLGRWAQRDPGEARDVANAFDRKVG